MTSAVYRFIWKVRQRGRIAAARWRAILWRLQGARLGPKVNVGPRCVLDRPWRLTAGPRVTLEAEVSVKLVEDVATVVVGEGSFLGRGTILDVAQRVEIGAHTLLAPRVMVVDHTHGIEGGVRIDAQPCRSAPVRIGADVWIGTGAVILPGVSIGDGAVIGAQALVRENVPAGAIAAGVPARVRRYRSAAGQQENGACSRS